MILILILAKLLRFPKLVQSEMKNPALASVSGTFTMGLLLLSAFLKPYLGILAEILWFLTIFLYACLIIYFSWTFVRRLRISDVYTGYLIIYVGPIAITNSAASFGQERIGQLAFWFGFACLWPVLALLGYRYLKFRQIPPGFQPLFGVFSAPFALCLVGYLKSFPSKSTGFVIFLVSFCLIFYLLGFLRIRSLFTREFYPSFASYTFPFVNSALAIKLSIAYFALSGVWGIFNLLQSLLALFLVLYVLTRYIIFLLRKDPKESSIIRP